MRRWKTKSGYEVIRVTAGRSNTYLISTENGNILVDTGWRFSRKGLRRNINALELSRPITSLILTHTHFDHCQNAWLIRQQDNCKIMMSEHEANFAQYGYTPIPKGTFGVTKILSRLGRAIGRRWFGYPSFIPDRLIGEELDLSREGYDIKIIGTTGHSEGSISIVIDNELAIVGDTMISIFKDSVFPPFADDTQALIRSWGKLLNTACQLFLPGHGKEITRELLQREFDKYSKRYSIH